MMELMQQDRALERESAELALQLRRSEGEVREKLAARLKETVNKHFEIRQQRRRLQFSRLESELKRLQETINQREELRGDLIQRRILELTGQPRELDF